MPKITDCGVTLLGLKVQITQELFRATFEEVGCFYLFLVLGDKSVTSFLTSAIFPESSASNIPKNQTAAVTLLPLESPLNTRVFGADFEGGGMFIPIFQFSGVKASHCR